MTINIRIVSYFFIVTYCVLSKSDAAPKKFNLTEILAKYGYPVEVHEIETEDGYLLDTYRVPYGVNSKTKEPNKYPVILNHGLMGSAENFIIGGPTKALPWVLADAGYDVWLLNARGTWHSRKHKTLDPDRDAKFWKFTFHEIGVYDLPASIDYILKKTHNTQLQYIGHSQGTTVFFVMASERPEYNKKVKLMIAMAPSAILENIKEISLRMLSPMYRYLQSLGETLQLYELIPNLLVSNEAARFLGKNLCGEQSNTKSLCTNIVAMVMGFTEEQLDPETIPLIMSTGPAGCSLYQPLHYAQMISKAKFIQFDWGPQENMKRYHSSVPPEYNLKNVTCPVSLMFGEADTLTTKEDAEILGQILPNLVDFYKVPYPQWTHMDFVFAKDVDKYINKHILRLLKKYSK